MKYYDIHVSYGAISGFSVFIPIKKGILPTEQTDEDIIGHAVDVGSLEPDDMKYVDKVTEIDEDEYNRATKA